VSTKAEPTPRWFRPAVAAVTAVGFVWRLAYTLVAKRNDSFLFDEGDSFFYSVVSTNLAHGQWFTVPFNGRPAADHPPLTVLVLTPASKLFENSVLAQRLTMTVIGTLAIVVIALLGRALAGPVAGVVAGAIAALNPNFWMNDAVVMSEAVSTVLIAALMITGLRLARAPTVGRAAAAGAVCGLTVLARAEMGLFLPFMILPILLVADGLHAWQRVGRIALAGLMTLAVVAPWTLSMQGRYDKPVAISTNDGTTLLGANCPEVYDTSTIGSWSLRCVEQTGTTTLDPSNDASKQRRIALDYIKAHEGRLPLVLVAREGRTFGFWRPDQSVFTNQGEGRPEWASWAGFVTFWVLTPFAVYGAVILRRRRVTLAPFLAALATVVVVSAFFYGIPRFRLPVDVAVTALAAVAAAELLSRRSDARPADPSSVEVGASLPTT
jgi:4-amino-4-deoxy-L-arabinose transferase-like glycosyltransferase